MYGSIFFSLTWKITTQVDLQLFLLVFIGGNIEYCSIVNEKQLIFYSGGEKTYLVPAAKYLVN